MNQFNSTERLILQQLSNGEFHTGTALGQLVGISRSAIWKSIKQLTEFGAHIEKDARKGYRLTNPLILLNTEHIKQGLPESLSSQLNFHLFSSIDSTNTYLKKLPSSHFIEVCCAEKQSEGRGRFGRNWISPFGENVYCSSRWRFEKDLSCLSGLSLVISIAIMRTLALLGVQENIGIKWPNDILWNNKKLCGTLIEINAESNAQAEVIIGIGLNVNSNTQRDQLTDKPWCSLFEITQTFHNRNAIISALLNQLYRVIEQFNLFGFSDFLTEWEKYDVLFGKAITSQQPSGILTGKAEGINALGQLVLRDEQGNTHYLSSGDTTLRAVY